MDHSSTQQSLIEKISFITNLLVGFAFIVNMFFYDYFKIYSYFVLPFILINSILVIYTSIKSKKFKKLDLLVAVFWIFIIMVLTIDFLIKYFKVM